VAAVSKQGRSPRAPKGHPPKQLDWMRAKRVSVVVTRPPPSIVVRKQALSVS